MHKWMLVGGAVFSLLSVILGAFAAHGLRGKLDENAIGIFQTAAHYQLNHGFALILCGILVYQFQTLPNSLFWLKISAFAFTFGIVFFSGSLYALALTSQKWLGPITPIGGLLFILGWICFILGIYRT